MYAKFLRGNNQFKLAEEFYRESLASYRKLAANNPTRYLPDVANVLNNLGILVKADSARSNKEAEKLYTEALDIQRNLAADNPSIYLPDVARTLNNLGNLGMLVSYDSNRRKAVETIYIEALSIRRKLADDNPNVYLPDIVETLGCFGYANLQWGELLKAHAYLQEAAEIIKPFATQHPNVYGDLQNTILHQLADSSSTTQ